MSRRTTVDDSRQVESRSFDVMKAVQIYFNDVVHVDGFILAVDETGVFFFTTLEDQQTILIKLSNYMDQLDLSKSEIVVCKVSWNAPIITDEIFFKRIKDSRFENLLFADVNPDSFEETTRLLLSNRNVCFSKDDIIDIIECFQPASLREGSLYSFVSDRGFEVDSNLILEFEQLPVFSLKDVITTFGEDNATELYDTIMDFRENYQCSIAVDKSDDLTYQKVSWDASANLAILLGSLLLAASLGMCLFKVIGLGLIFAIMAFLQARHLSLIYKNAAATIITWFSVALMIYSSAQLLLFFLPQIKEMLRSLLLIES